MIFNDQYSKVHDLKLNTQHNVNMAKRDMYNIPSKPEKI